MTAHRKAAFEPAATFVRRHIGPSPRNVAAMLETCLLYTSPSPRD